MVDLLLFNILSEFRRYRFYYCCAFVFPFRNHIWSNYGSIMPNRLNMPISNIFGALLILEKKWLSYEPKTIYPYLGINTRFDSKRPIIRQLSIFLNETKVIMKSKPKLHVPCNL